MLKCRFLLVLCFIAMNSFAQDVAYKEELKTFQHQYIKDLYEIIKGDTAYIDFYPLNKKLILKAKVMELEGQKVFKMITSSGKSKEARKHALLVFTIDQVTYQLYAYQLISQIEKNAHHLFVPFMDKTCGKGSYGGGRYIDLDISDINNKEIVLDFNKAYNPYCAFTTGYNCPIPPRENTLPIPIRAGEQYQKSKFKH